MTKCIAAIGEGVSICTNGFPQSNACHREQKCFSCGTHSKAIPACLKEDWTDISFKVWFNEDGIPKHYRGNK